MGQIKSLFSVYWAHFNWCKLYSAELHITAWNCRQHLSLQQYPNLLMFLIMALTNFLNNFTHFCIFNSHTYHTHTPVILTLIRKMNNNGAVPPELFSQYSCKSNSDLPLHMNIITILNYSTFYISSYHTPYKTINYSHYWQFRNHKIQSPLKY